MESPQMGVKNAIETTRQQPKKLVANFLCKKNLCFYSLYLNCTQKPSLCKKQKKYISILPMLKCTWPQVLVARIYLPVIIISSINVYESYRLEETGTFWKWLQFECMFKQTKIEFFFHKSNVGNAELEYSFLESLL